MTSYTWRDIIIINHWRDIDMWHDVARIWEWGIKINVQRIDLNIWHDMTWNHMTWRDMTLHDTCKWYDSGTYHWLVTGKSIERKQANIPKESRAPQISSAIAVLNTNRNQSVSSLPDQHSLRLQELSVVLIVCLFVLEILCFVLGEVFFFRYTDAHVQLVYFF